MSDGKSAFRCPSATLGANFVEKARFVQIARGDEALLGPRPVPYSAVQRLAIVLPGYLLQRFPVVEQSSTKKELGFRKGLETQPPRANSRVSARRLPPASATPYSVAASSIGTAPCRWVTTARAVTRRRRTRPRTSEQAVSSRHRDAFAVYIFKVPDSA